MAAFSGVLPCEQPPALAARCCPAARSAMVHRPVERVTAADRDAGNAARRQSVPLAGAPGPIDGRAASDPPRPRTMIGCAHARARPVGEARIELSPARRDACRAEPSSRRRRIVTVKTNFYSDNVSGAAPEILQALVDANAGD